MLIPNVRCCLHLKILIIHACINISTWYDNRTRKHFTFTSNASAFLRLIWQGLPCFGFVHELSKNPSSPYNHKKLLWNESRKSIVTAANTFNGIFLKENCVPFHIYFNEIVWQQRCNNISFYICIWYHCEYGCWFGYNKRQQTNC